MTKWQNRKYDKFKKASLFYRFLIRSCYSGNFWMKLQNFCVIILVKWRQHQKVQMKYFWWQHRMTKWHFFRLKSNNENVRDDLDSTMTSNCRKSYLRKYGQIVFKGWFGYLENITEKSVWTLNNSNEKEREKWKATRECGRVGRAVGGCCLGILEEFVW